MTFKYVRCLYPYLNWFIIERVLFHIFSNARIISRNFQKNTLTTSGGKTWVGNDSWIIISYQIGFQFDNISRILRLLAYESTFFWYYRYAVFSWNISYDWVIVWRIFSTSCRTGNVLSNRRWLKMKCWASVSLTFFSWFIR